MMDFPAFLERVIKEEGFRHELYKQLVSKFSTNQDWEALVSEALDYVGVPKPVNKTSEYYNNLVENSFTKNEGDRKKAAAIYFYLHHKHQDVARAVDLVLFKEELPVAGKVPPQQNGNLPGKPYFSRSKFSDDANVEEVFAKRDQGSSKIHTWSYFVAKYAMTDRIKLVVENIDESAIARLGGQEAETPQQLQLGQGFKFRIQTDQNGLGIAFQLHKGRAYPLPFSRHCLHFVVVNNVCEFPSQAEAFADRYLYENEDTGMHTFLFLILACELSEEILSIETRLVPGYRIRKSILNAHSRWILENANDKFSLLKLNVNFHSRHF